MFTVRIDIGNVTPEFSDPIYNGSGYLPSNGQSSDGFATGYGYSASFVVRRVTGIRWKRRSSAKEPFGTIRTHGIFGDGARRIGQIWLGIFNNDGSEDWTETGYRWDGTSWASEFLRQLPPIVLDLNGAGGFSSSVSVRFDVDGDGDKDRAGWIGGGQGFLVLDRNRDGIIDRGSELSFVQDLPGPRTIRGPRAYDGNETESSTRGTRASASAVGRTQTKTPRPIRQLLCLRRRHRQLDLCPYRAERRLARQRGHSMLGSRPCLGDGVPVWRACFALDADGDPAYRVTVTPAATVHIAQRHPVAPGLGRH